MAVWTHEKNRTPPTTLTSSVSSGAYHQQRLSSMPRATFKNKTTSSYTGGHTKRNSRMPSHADSRPPGASGHYNGNSGANTGSTGGSSADSGSLTAYSRSFASSDSNKSDATYAENTSASTTAAFQAYVNHHRDLIKGRQNTDMLVARVEELRRLSDSLTYRHQLRYKWNTDREIEQLCQLIEHKLSGAEAEVAEAVIQKYVDAYNIVSAAADNQLPEPQPASDQSQPPFVHASRHQVCRTVINAAPPTTMPNEIRKRKSACHKNGKDGKASELTGGKDTSLSTQLRNSLLLATATERKTYNQESVQHELMRELENKAPPLYVVQGDVCHKCNIPLIILASDALLGCPRCSHTRLYIQATSSRIAYGEEVEFANFSYKRQNHFQVRMCEPLNV